MNHSEREIERVLLDVVLLGGEQDVAPDLFALVARAKAILAKRDQERRFARASRSTRNVRAPGKTREERRVESDAAYDLSKLSAWNRSGGRCEYDTGSGVRCDLTGEDTDHALGGAYRKECERLGAEGLIVACRCHHQMKHANLPTHRYWLDEAKVHAIRIGGRRLLALVEKALARDEARHPGRAARAGGTHG